MDARTLINNLTSDFQQLKVTFVLLYCLKAHNVTADVQLLPAN